MANNPIAMDTSLSSLNSADNDTSATSSAHIDSQQSKWTSASTSVTESPIQSRDPSPSRPSVNTGRTSRTSTSSPAAGSRKSSLQNPSPSRTKPNLRTPSSTPRQQLSSATTPSLPPPSTSGTVLRAPVPQKATLTSELSKDAPRWPVSPRLKSPPPNIGRPTGADLLQKSELEISAVNVRRATPSPSLESASQSASENETEESQSSSGMRTPARGPSNGSSTLETVQEVSQPNTPRPGIDIAIEKLAETAAAQSSPQSKSSWTTVRKAESSQHGTNSESGSDGGNAKTNQRRTSTTATPSLHSRQSSTAIKFGGKGPTSGESSSRNMTVETEQINNLQGISLVPSVRGQGGNGSLRTKPSSETIKPKKDKKKHTRKPASVASGNGETPDDPNYKRRLVLSYKTIPYLSPLSTRSSFAEKFTEKMTLSSYDQGSSFQSYFNRFHYAYKYKEYYTPAQPPSRSWLAKVATLVNKALTFGRRPASSKADIFEAKVASAVEEANSSDSDETFVYDSNPPELADRPRRYHSRTPSATSMASQVDRSGMRSLGGMLETGPPAVPVKKNMKFVNATYTSSGTDGPLADDDGRSTTRSNAGSARGTSRHHHHPGRWGRNNSNTHTSLFDNESPFPSSTKSKFSSNSRQSSNPPSPRFNTGRGWASNKRQMTLPGTYDMDDTTTGADDERTPLLNGGTRSIRSTRSRRNVQPRNLEAQTYERRRTFITRFASCLVLTLMLLMVLSGAIAFMFATSQPLTDIELVKIGNVLASEQELMMDITVKARNPNVVVVMVDTADLEIFAKSPHAGTDSEWWRHPSGDEFGTLDDPKNDPPIIKLPGDPDYNDKPSEDKPPEDSMPNMRLGNVVVFDSPLTYEGTFFQRGVSTSTGSLRLSRPGNSTDSGTERWEHIISDEFTLIVKGVLKYSLPLSQRIRNVAISGKTIVKPNSANNPSLRPNETEIAVQ
ncbi:hypothetical protein ABKA04_004172 [Annulohypoxylon sp. FPYF3050]